MTKNLFRSLLLVAVATLLLAPAVFAGSQDFTLHNETGVDIHQLFVSPATTQDWEEDVLGVDILKDGAAVAIKFSPEHQAETWDLMVVDGEGVNITWAGLDLTKISSITLYFEDGVPTADLE
jgi:hypothetical protein